MALARRPGGWRRDFVQSGLADEETRNQVPESAWREWTVLLYCARTHVEPGVHSDILDHLGRVNWDRLLRFAAWHEVMPLLYRSLRHWPDAVPDSVRGSMAEYCRDIAFRNLFLTNELLALLQALKSQGVSAVPYKGPVLAASAYGDVALREFHDLDILVRKRDVPKAKEVLSSRGYVPTSQDTGDSGPEEPGSTCASSFERADGQVRIDLHWGVTLLSHFAYPLEEDSFWSKIESVSLWGAEVPGIAPEVLLQILCIHGSRHCWGTLKWICDVAELIRQHPELDWDRVMHEAQSHGNERMLFVGLRLASGLLGAELPETIRRRIEADPAIESSVAAVSERLIDPFDTSPARTLDSYLFRLGMRRDVRSRVPYFIELTKVALKPNMQDRAWIKLPSRLSFLYYIARPVRLVFKYGLRCFRLPARLLQG